MSDLRNELAKLIAKAGSASGPVDSADDVVVSMIQRQLPAGVGAPAFDVGILERARDGGTLAVPSVLAIQAAYEVIQELLKEKVRLMRVVDAAKEFDACLEGETSQWHFSDKQLQLHEALEDL